MRPCIDVDAFFQFVLFSPDPWGQFMKVVPAVFGSMAFPFAVLGGIVSLLFYRIFRQRWRRRKVQEAFPEKADYRREVFYSLTTLLIFALFGYAIFSPWVFPLTQIYLEVDTFGWVYLAGSVVLMVLLHDAYFYWAHRLMHTRLLYRHFHAIHHRSNNPSPWAAFSFHPLEAIVEAGIIFPIVFIIPAHPLAIAIFFVIMTTFNVLGHVGYEFFPSWFTKNKFGGLLNTSTSHNLHHQHHRTNFGLYFRFWDLLCGTTDKDYQATLSRVQD